MMKIDWGNIPLELQFQDHWLLWKYQLREGALKPTKVPYQLNSKPASVSDPTQWAPFELVEDAVKDGRVEDYDGIGYVFAKNGGWVGIDLDDCIKGSVTEGWAQEIVNNFGSYAEVSPSGTGIKIWSAGELPIDKDKSGKKAKYETGSVEMYQHSRYFTVTGQIV